VRLSGIDLSEIDRVLGSLKIDRSVKPVSRFTGGYRAARESLDFFIEGRLKDYDEGRNDPSKEFTSALSPYLHFGQISPLEVALAVQKTRGVKRSNIDAFLEQLIVRRELSMNFVHYEPNTYDSYKALPGWAQATLRAHRKDTREYTYTRPRLESARTHDEYWNAAMREMLHTGTMHNYMRMYWGKQILLWSRSPQSAFRTALYLNNKYFLDGRDPNAYCNVGWIFGLHDRPWPERKVLGTVRTMTASGLERKFDIRAYVERMQAL
jgi:deoxyribodipyrimidine photo-lyase